MASRRAKQERLKQKQQVEKTTKHKQYQQDKTTKDNVFVLSAPLGHLFVVVKNWYFSNNFTGNEQIDKSIRYGLKTRIIKEFFSSLQTGFLSVSEFNWLEI